MKKFKIVLIIIMILTVAFIFFQSIQSRDSSNEESGRLLKLIKSMLSFLPQSVNDFFDAYLRKMAHFTEFFILGCEFSLFVSICLEKKWLFSTVHSVAWGLFVAVTDESLQMISGRSPEVRDILIDISGVILATLIVSTIVMIIKKHRANTTND